MALNIYVYAPLIFLLHKYYNIERWDLNKILN